MKKVYCFYCQQDVAPKKFLWWRVCPECQHRLTDNGDGFYKVCDACGANMPVDAKVCVQCGKGAEIDGLPAALGLTDVKSVWLLWLIRIAAVVFSIILAVGILYISFYLVFVLLALGLAFFVFQLFWPTRRF